MLRRAAISFFLVLVSLSAQARTRPHYGGTLHVEIEGDAWQRPDGLARRLVLDGLTRTSPEGAILPALATDWKPEDDNHRWQFHLRPGVHFSDGTPLTPATVVTALNSACSRDCLWNQLRAAAGSVVFITDTPSPNLPALLAGDDYLIAIQATGGGLIGTGPFQANGFTNGVLTLIANENSWQGRPFADSIEIRTHRAIHDQWLDLGLGHADVVEVPAEQIRAAQQQHLKLLVSPPVSLLALAVPETGRLADANLRSAIALAVDRGALSNVIFQHQGEITASLLPASVTGYAFLFATDRNLAKAHELHPASSTQPILLSTSGGAPLQLAAQRIALNLRDAGINAQLATSVQQADISLRTWNLETREPGAALESLLRRFGSAAPFHDETPAALYRVESEFLQRHTLIPLLYLPRAWAVSDRVRDLHLDAAGLPDLADAALESVP